MKTASWVVRNKHTKEVVAETFNSNVAKAINKKKYEAVPTMEYLCELNRNIKEQNNAR